MLRHQTSSRGTSSRSAAQPELITVNGAPCDANAYLALPNTAARATHSYAQLSST